MTLATKRASLLILALLITAGSLFPSIQNKFTNWDDGEYVTENTLIRDISPASIKGMFVEPVSSNFHPLTIFSFAVEYKFAGLNPFFYHLTNLVIHLLNTGFVFLFIYLLCRNGPVAFLTALLFGIHPLHVESVAWISERKDVLYTFFYLSSLIAYIRYLERANAGAYVLSFLLFILSCLAKSMAVTLPAVLLLIDYYRSGKLTRGNIIAKVHFFAVSAAVSFIAVMTQRAQEVIERTQEVFGSLMNVYVAVKGICFYLWKIIIPVHLSAIYPMPPAVRGGELALDIAVVAALSLAIYFSRKKSRIYIFGGLFFLITILPVLKFIPIGNAIFAADRYTYVPSIGFCQTFPF